MSILSNKPEKYICDDFEVSVNLHNPQTNQKYINVHELGISSKNPTSPEHIFNITRRLMELFEGMPTEVLDSNILQASVSNILLQPGRVLIDKNRLQSTILITYYLEKTDNEILTISLQYKEWGC